MKYIKKTYYYLLISFFIHNISIFTTDKQKNVAIIATGGLIAAGVNNIVNNESDLVKNRKEQRKRDWEPKDTTVFDDKFNRKEYDNQKNDNVLLKKDGIKKNRKRDEIIKADNKQSLSLSSGLTIKQKEGINELKRGLETRFGIVLKKNGPEDVIKSNNIIEKK
jgi:hypothetical protein